jgi:hypothetical protein
MDQKRNNMDQLHRGCHEHGECSGLDRVGCKKQKVQ